MASLSLKNIYKVYPNGFNAVKDWPKDWLLLWLSCGLRPYD